MKGYPSIIRASQGEFGMNVHLFDKLDGSNMRFDWDVKRGWWQFGTRHRVVTVDHSVFGSAQAIFQDKFADEIARIAKSQKWQAAVCFAEFYGALSFAGLHEDGDTKKLTLIDVAPFKQCILSPLQFVDMFGHLDCATYLGEVLWTPEFVAEVRAGKIDGVSFEGVVGKYGERHHLKMVKAKTQAWIDEVLKRYSAEEAQQILDS